MDIGEEALLHLALAALGIVDEGRADTDIHEEGRGIGEIAHTGVVRHHGEDGTVVLEDGGLAQGHVLEHQRHLVFMLGGGAGCHCLGGAAHEGICCRGREAGGGGQGGAGARKGCFWAAANSKRIHLLNDFRDVNIHEMIEGLQLVRHDLSSL